MAPVKRSVQIRAAMSQRLDCLLDVWEMTGPVCRDVEQRPLTVDSRAHSRGILRKEQIQGGYVAAVNRLGCLVLHLADDSSSLTRLADMCGIATNVTVCDEEVTVISRSNATRQPSRSATYDRMGQPEHPGGCA